VPVLGPLVKQAVATTYLRVRRYWAHPNRLANEMIVPELIGRLTPDAIARQLQQMLDVPLAWTAQRLRAAMGEPGASGRLVDEVLRVASERA
jgi:lipid-A-disaccharide synthase